MNFNYNNEIENILNRIYEKKIYNIVDKQDFKPLNSKEVIESYIEILKNTPVYLGSDLDDFIENLIENNENGYFLRVEIAKKKNYSFPKLYDYLGNPIKNTSYSKFAMELWEGNMNRFIIEDLQSRFSQNGFIEFINNNFINMVNDLNKYIDSKNKKSIITIPFKEKDELLPTLKSMILKNEVDNSFIYLLVDIDALRDEMAKFSATFHVYNEFDKLEDDLEYCLDNFSRYDSSQLFDILVNDHGFKYIENIGLVKS